VFYLAVEKVSVPILKTLDPRGIPVLCANSMTDSILRLWQSEFKKCSYMFARDGIKCESKQEGSSFVWFLFVNLFEERSRRSRRRRLETAKEMSE
jgi:hypothetical protein